MQKMNTRPGESGVGGDGPGVAIDSRFKTAGVL